MFLTRHSSRKKLSCNDFEFLCVGKLSELLMFHLVTSSLCYGDVITASAAGHRDQVTSSLRDYFTGSFFSRLCIDCSINVDDSCAPVVLCLLLRAIFTWFFFFLVVRHTPESVNESCGFAIVSFPGLVFQCMYVSLCIAYNYTAVWLANIFYCAFLQFYHFHVTSGVVLPLISQATWYSFVPVSALHSLSSVSSPITCSPTLERYNFFWLVCSCPLIFTQNYSSPSANNFVLISWLVFFITLPWIYVVFAWSVSVCNCIQGRKHVCV